MSPVMSPNNARNLMAYIHWRGDLPFSLVPPGPVDQLIFSLLSYSRLEKASAQVLQPLRDLVPVVWPVPPADSEVYLQQCCYGIWQSMREYPRFADVRLHRFVSRFSSGDGLQFAAALFHVNGMGCVAFRGTDATVTGWKEDLMLACEDPVPAQLYAREFLCEAAALYPALTVCGHSKGGNLAVYAAAASPESVQRKITACYDFDGPGMNNSLLKSEGYLRVRERIYSYIPESSVIGLLLKKDTRTRIVRSDSVGLMQHNPFYWHVQGPDFISAAGTTVSSRVVSTALKDFLNGCPQEQRMILAGTLGEILSVGGESRVGDVPAALLSHPEKVIAIIENLPAEHRRALMHMLRLMADSGAGSLQQVLGDSLSRLIPKA